MRSIFSAWMHSAGHRENILGPYGQIGIGLRVGGLDGHGGAHVWTQEFGQPRMLSVDSVVRSHNLGLPACPRPSTSATATATSPPS